MITLQRKHQVCFLQLCLCIFLNYRPQESLSLALPHVWNRNLYLYFSPPATMRLDNEKAFPQFSLAQKQFPLAQVSRFIQITTRWQQIELKDRFLYLFSAIWYLFRCLQHSIFSPDSQTGGIGRDVYFELGWRCKLKCSHLVILLVPRVQTLPIHSAISLWCCSRSTAFTMQPKLPEIFLDNSNQID